jgi:hypothetical protein
MECVRGCGQVEGHGMTTFDSRGQGFEAEFQHDQELLFRIQNRRNKLLGLWAAELIGLTGADAEAYAKEVIMSDFERQTDEDVHDKVYADLKIHDIDLSDHRLRKKMDALLAVARQQIMTEATPK